MTPSRREFIQSAASPLLISLSASRDSDNARLIKIPKDAQIRRILVSNGSIVRPDQPLLELDRGQEELSSKLAVNAIERLEAVAKLLSPEIVGPNLDLLKANLDSLKKTVVNRGVIVDSVRGELAAGSRTAIDLPRAEASLIDAQRAVRLAESELLELEFKISLYREIRQTLLTELRKEEALRKRFEALATVRSPFEGRIAFLYGEGTSAKKGAVVAKVLRS